jgi:hypothetical protein
MFNVDSLITFAEAVAFANLRSAFNFPNHDYHFETEGNDDDAAMRSDDDTSSSDQSKRRRACKQHNGSILYAPRLTLCLSFVLCLHFLILTCAFLAVSFCHDHLDLIWWLASDLPSHFGPDLV